jgi:aminopeptidase N
LSMQRSLVPLRRLRLLGRHLRGACCAVSTEASAASPIGKFRADYAPPPFVVSQVHLIFQLREGELPTTVHCRLEVERSPEVGLSGAPEAALQLEGEELDLQRVALNGSTLAGEQYELSEDYLTLPAPLLDGLRSFTVETEVEISPHNNLQLSGLYKSSGMFCTQCEAEGFRRITYMQDRPDVMAVYFVRVEADSASNPVLLSNGNLTGSGALEGGRHWTEWHDPWPKPSYLFALVAGDLGVLRDSFTTASNREVALAIYSEHDKIEQCHHSMQALKDSMRWDEEVYGLEYDLDLFNIVAVSDL